MSIGHLAVTLLICFCLMYGGNLIGNMLSMVLSGGNAENTVVTMAMDSNPLKILVMVVLAPLFEEYLFRRQIIDRTRQFGEKTAVMFSAVTFALLHQNLFQFFYAFGLGWVFAYIYTRTGRLRYSVILHGIINFFGSVLAPWILSLVDLEAMNAINPNAPTEELLATYQQILPGMMILSLYSMILMGFSISGLVLLLINRKKIVWKDAATPLPAGSAAKTVYANIGMILFILICLASFVFALL